MRRDVPHLLNAGAQATDGEFGADREDADHKDEVCEEGEEHSHAALNVCTAQAVAEPGLPFVFSDGHGIGAFTKWYDDLRLEAEQ